MSNKIVTLSDRGQVTIPAKIRQQIKAEHFHCKIQKGQIVLIPLIAQETTVGQQAQVKEPREPKQNPTNNQGENQHLWSKHGGLTIEEAIKQSKEEE
jgi:bifunctional DNA-binding transcriptional regulator/antitoxin component of YhaV-PrlF toxin-antitoxin module